MARIRRWEVEHPELFLPNSLVLVTPMLYEKIRKSIERRIGKELKEITAQYLMEKYGRHAEGGVCIVMHHEMVTMAILKADPSLALGVFDIGPVHVSARLRFPLSGEVFRINAFLGEIMREKKLEHRVEVSGGEIEIKVQLIDGDEPKLDPRCGSDRYGRKTYCCAREVWRYESDERMKRGG